MSADDPGRAAMDGATQQSEQTVDGASEANAPISYTRLLNRPLLFTVVAMVALAALLVLSYFLPWSHFEPGYGQSWPPGDTTDGQPIILWSFVSQSPFNIALTTLLVLMGPPLLYAIVGLLGLSGGRKGRIIAGVFTSLIGLWCAITTLLVWFGSGICDCAVVRVVDIGGWCGILASLLMPMLALSLLAHKGKLFAYTR